MEKYFSTSDHEIKSSEKPKNCGNCLFYGRVSNECSMTRSEKTPESSCEHWAGRDTSHQPREAGAATPPQKDEKTGYPYSESRIGRIALLALLGALVLGAVAS